ncbi:MAG: outer membrane beta-barrel protein [Bacteroidetes bacterium]|nr:outer membrane beta-barrel protein [Bacteroidota bacterium]
MKKLILFFIFIPLYSVAQQVTIKGKITEEKGGLSVPGATIILVNANDTTLKNGVVADFDGKFEFSGIEKGNYKLRVTFMGLENIEQDLPAFQPIVDAGTIKMKANVQLLKGIEVKEMQVRVEQKGDTTQYNADAFKTNPDASTEDLVTKMPGITVENGEIKAQGENVKQVLVDGKLFFGNDPNMALKNIPAEIVSHVQVFDQLSDQSRFTGVDDGNTSKTINIITRSGKNNGQFGRVYGGYGTDGRYNGGFTLNSFKGDRKITLLGISNNINQQNFSEEDILGATGGSSRRGGYRRNPALDNFMIGQANGISTTNAVGINYADSWGKKVNISGSYFVNSSENNQVNNLSRSFFSPLDSGLVYNEGNIAKSNNLNHRANMRLEYNIDSLNSLIITPRISFQTNGSNNAVNGNFLREGFIPESSTFNNLVTTSGGYNISNGILYRRKLKKERRSLSINLDTDIRDNDALRNQLSRNEYFTTNEEIIIDQQTNQYNRGINTSSNITFTEPLGEKSVLQINYNPSYSISNSERDTRLVDPINDEYSILDTALSNKFDNIYFANKVGTVYMFNNKKINFTGGASFQNATLNGHQHFPQDQIVNRTFNNILPEAMFTYNFSEAASYRIRYRTSTSAPNVNQLQTVVNNSNPLLLSTGNADLTQSYNHNIFTRFGKTNVPKGRSFFVFVFGSYTQDFITNETFIPRGDTTLADGTQLTRGMQLTRPINMDGFWNARTYISYGLPVSKLKSNLNLNTGISMVRSPGLINNQVNFANNYGLNSGFTLGSNFSDKIDFNLSYNANYSIVKNTLQRQSDNNFFVQTSSAKLNWIFWKGLIFNASVNHILFTGLSQDFNQDFLLVNSSLGYKFLKDKSLEIRVSVFDLLGQNTSISRNVTETFVEDLQSNVLNRYLMFSLTYHLKKFKPAPERVR